MTARRPRFPDGSPGLLPTVVQDDRDGRVLGVAYSSPDSWRRLVPGGGLVLYSRSRRELWRKGATSGNTATVVATAVDCDGDALLVRVLPDGPYCHSGARGCFEEGRGATPAPGAASELAELETLVAGRRRAPRPGSYTSRLLADEEERLKKVGEEATEVVVAAARGDRAAVRRETADLLYHLAVLLGALDVPWAEVAAELAGRRGAPRRGAGGRAAPPREGRAARLSGRGSPSRGRRPRRPARSGPPSRGRSRNP